MDWIAWLSEFSQIVSQLAAKSCDCESPLKESYLGFTSSGEFTAHLEVPRKARRAGVLFSIYPYEMISLQHRHYPVLNSQFLVSSEFIQGHSDTSVSWGVLSEFHGYCPHQFYPVRYPTGYLSLPCEAGAVAFCHPLPGVACHWYLLEFECDRAGGAGGGGGSGGNGGGSGGSGGGDEFGWT